MKKSFFLFLVPMFIVACSKSVPVEIFNEEKPYTVEITKERSYFQADRIVKRLAKMGLGAYVLENNTSDGQWYRVASGALVDSIQTELYIAHIDSLYRLKPAVILNYAELDSVSRTPIQKEAVHEQHKIDANPPCVQDEIMQVIRKYPDNVMFNLNKIGLLELSDMAIKSAQYSKLDMPRGVKLAFLKEHGCSAIACVIYEDNLYKDQVTLHVVKCNESALDLCSEIGDKILKTGNYNDERKEKFESKAYSKLTGYKVSFDEKNHTRTYYIFTDKKGEFVYMAQTTKADETEFLDFLTQIGNSQGLIEYDEFYNTFYTIADKPVENDVFLGYYVSRLGWSYARDRGYSKWSKQMVGHMSVDCQFYNKPKGMWSVGLYDLLTEEAQSEIYQDLYQKTIKAKYHRDLYGKTGLAIYYHDLRGRDISLSEVNLGFGRYILGASGTKYFSENDLIQRIEALQLIKGGYHPDQK